MAALEGWLKLDATGLAEEKAGQGEVALSSLKASDHGGHALSCLWSLLHIRGELSKLSEGRQCGGAVGRTALLLLVRVPRAVSGFILGLQSPFGASMCLG